MNIGHSRKLFAKVGQPGHGSVSSVKNMVVCMIWSNLCFSSNLTYVSEAQSENKKKEVLEAVAPFPHHKDSESGLGTEEEDDCYSDDEEGEEEEGENDDTNDEDDILDGITLKKLMSSKCQAAVKGRINFV